MSLRSAALALALALASAPAAQRSTAQQPDAPKVSLTPLPPEDPALEPARRAMDASRFQQAEPLLRAFLSAHPRSAPAHTLLAYCLLRLDKPREALPEYTRAAAIEPPSPEDLKHVAQAYVLLDDYADATKWAAVSVQKDPADPDAWYTLGRIHYTDQRFQAAADSFLKVLTLSPRSVRAENNLGLALEALDRSEEAAQAYRQAIAWGEQESASTPGSAAIKGLEQPMLNLAILLVHRAERGDLDQALLLLQRAVGIAPRDPRIHEQLGHIYLQQEALPAAQAEFEQAIALDPTKGAFHFLLGQTYRREGLQDKAKAEFDRAAGMMGSHTSER